MKRSKFTEAQIAFILRQAEEGAYGGRGLPQGADQRGDLLWLAQGIRRACRALPVDRSTSS